LTRSSRIVALGTPTEDLALGQVHPANRLLDGSRNKILLERGEGNRAAGLEGENLGDLGATALYDFGCF
jgi:hypothetical protein